MAVRRTTLMRETAAFRRLWSAPGRQIRFTTHARKEMRNDQIVEADVRFVLARNGVCWMEQKTNELWHVEGNDVDGRSIRVVLAAFEAELVILIVTVMEL